MLQAPISLHLPEKPVLHGHHVTKRHPHIKHSCKLYRQFTGLRYRIYAEVLQQDLNAAALNVGPGWWNVINQRIMDRKVGGC